MIWSIIKGFLFLLDAETAHRLTLMMIRLGMIGGQLPLRLMSGASSSKTYRKTKQVFGVDFMSPVGLAAGFDKDAEILEALPSLGFGFAEIGTVTPRPQPGNERPRLFRDIPRQAIFNRMGFNGLGATLVAERVARARKNLPETFRVGINVGKNKDTPLDQAALDYAAAVTPFEGLADYLVINVSSPNTPGLRSLQTMDALKPIISAVNDRIDRWTRRPPLLLKLAPELAATELAEIMHAAESWGINGWVLTNTLDSQWSLPGHPVVKCGLSGAPLTNDSRGSLASARRFSRLPIISVGGIMSADEAALRLAAGADLVQIYTGWIYGGPSFPAEINRKIAEI